MNRMRKYICVVLLILLDSVMSRGVASEYTIVQRADMQERLNWVNVENVRNAMKSMERLDGYDKMANEQAFERLCILMEQGVDGLETGEVAALQRATEILSLYRSITLSNPLLDVDKLVVGRYKLGSEARTVFARALGLPHNNHSTYTIQTSGVDASYEILSDLRSDKQQLTRIYKPEKLTSIPDLKLHWNAKKMLFSMPHSESGYWQIYEINTDGTGLKQVTNGCEDKIDYLDATYLPDGNIIANADIGVHGVPCVNGSDPVANLCLIDRTSKKVRRLTFDQDANWGPVVMNNGKIMYVRWEYTDLTHYFSRIVMTMNPDGTEQKAYYGSGSVFPTSILDVQPIPNESSRFVGIISGHHGVPRAGRMILFDPTISRKEEKGMVQEFPFSKRPIIPIVKDEMVKDVWPQFTKPIPLSAEYYIVTAKLNENSLWGIYLVDTYDNLTLIVEEEGCGYIYGAPLKESSIPPVVPTRVDLASKEATVFIQDIYEGEALPNVPRGTVKELRVFAYEYVYQHTTSDHVFQGIQSGWDIKRLLGTVPVEEDGSVMFKVPANTPISLQPLDSEGRAVQWMRSWITGQPGEIVSCVGCHEDQNMLPIPRRSLASLKNPQEMQVPEGGVRSVTFKYEIQPILNRNCTSCHNGEKTDIDFTAGRTDSVLNWNKSYYYYEKSYLAFHPYIHRQGPEAGMKVLYPYEYHASVSPMVQMLKSGHYGVELTDNEWRTLYRWIDLNAPGRGDLNANELHDVKDQKVHRRYLADKYANGMSVDWEEELRNYAQYLASKGTVTAKEQTYKASKFKEVKQKGYPFVVNEQAERKMLTLPSGNTMSFVKIPKGKFVMGKNEPNANYAPAHKAEVKEAFWMSECEVTNELYAELFPEHDSRYVDQQWKDHVNEGYPANRPEQPVIRVSYDEAMAFCTKMSELLGVKMTLPTETQWEWAARAGTDTDFWYGNLGSDFAKYENLSDKQMFKMAVDGVDPKPMAEDHNWYRLFTYHPKDGKVDDGNMIMVAPSSYESSPFGLYDMHGNVAEWTCSDYANYKRKDVETEVRKVVRGGSWKDHPKRATSYHRLPYYSHQKVYNVGFRVIIEE